MVLHAGAGGAAKVEPDIEPFRTILRVEGLLAQLRQIEKLVKLLAPGVAQKRNMPVGHDQNMSSGIGVQIEDREGTRSPVQDEVPLIVTLHKNRAENAGFAGTIQILNVVEAPRGPEMIHYWLMRSLSSLPGLK